MCLLVWLSRTTSLVRLGSCWDFSPGRVARKYLRCSLSYRKVEGKSRSRRIIGLRKLCGFEEGDDEWIEILS